MKQAKIYTFTLGANAAYNLLVAGEFFKVLAASGSLRVDAPNFLLDGISTGQGLEKTPFDRLTFTDKSGAGNTVTVVVGDQNFLDGTLGNVSITATKAPKSALVHTAPAIGAASAQALAANASRQYLMIQNNDPASTLWVRADGAAATKVAPAFKIPPGGFWEPITIPTGAVMAIGDAANNNATFIEG
jgi:hypothetical protein